ncbi:hypothetical protein QYF36_004793 [Acer negundo]|nr:hypothetical protein QYF36_004793 [Acer negundo]
MHTKNRHQQRFSKSSPNSIGQPPGRLPILTWTTPSTTTADTLSSHRTPSTSSIPGRWWSVVRVDYSGVGQLVVARI